MITKLYCETWFCVRGDIMILFAVVIVVCRNYWLHRYFRIIIWASWRFNNEYIRSNVTMHSRRCKVWEQRLLERWEICKHFYDFRDWFVSCREHIVSSAAGIPRINVGCAMYLVRSNMLLTFPFYCSLYSFHVYQLTYMYFRLLYLKKVPWFRHCDKLIKSVRLILIVCFGIFGYDCYCSALLIYIAQIQ